MTGTVSINMLLSLYIKNSAQIKNVKTMYRQTCILPVLVSVNTHDHLVGLMIKASATRAEDPGVESCLCRDFLRGRVTPVT